MEATASTDETFEKIVLMLDATPGITAPAATATKPAISAYSIRSCPRVSFSAFNLENRFFIVNSPPTHIGIFGGLFVESQVLV